MALATEQGFPLWLACGTILRGWALAAQGQGEEGIAQMRQGWPPSGPREQSCDRPYFLALLAEAYGDSWADRRGAARCWPRRWPSVTDTGERC